jgi:hypothetical protein
VGEQGQPLALTTQNILMIYLGFPTNEFVDGSNSVLTIFYFKKVEENNIFLYCTEDALQRGSAYHPTWYSDSAPQYRKFNFKTHL